MALLFYDFMSTLYKRYQLATLHSCVRKIAEVLVDRALLFYSWEMQPLEGNTSIWFTDQRMKEKDSLITFSSVSFGWIVCLPQPIMCPARIKGSAMTFIRNKRESSHKQKGHSLDTASCE